MKQTLLLAPAVAILLLGGILFLTTNTHDHFIPNTETELKTDAPLAALRLEFLKTRDPYLNTVPAERLYAAMEFLADRAGSANAFAKGTGINYSAITWTELGPTDIGGRTRAIIFDLNDATRKHVFAGAVGGGLWRCNDITATTTLAGPVWTPVNDQFANLAVTTIAQDTATPSIIYFGTGEGWGNIDAIKGGGIWKSPDGGNTFTRLSSTAGVSDFDYVQKIIVTSNGNVYAATRSGAGTGGIMKSADGGASWTRVIGTNAVNNRGADLEIGSNGDLFATVGIFSTGHIFRSPVTAGATQGDAGTWTDITPTLTFTPSRIEIATGPSTTLYALYTNPSTNTCDTITSSIDNGTTWTGRTSPTYPENGTTPRFTRDQSWYDLICTVDPVTPTTVYIGGVDLYRSTNSGAAWTRITSWYGGLPALHADQHAITIRPGNVANAVVGNDGGVFYCTNINTGNTFYDGDQGYNVTQYYAVSTHPTDPNYYLAGAQDNGTEQFTSPGLNNARDVIGGDGAFNFIDKTNGNNQIASYVYNNYYASNDGGLNFYALNGSDNTGQFINPADLDDANDILYSAAGNNQLARWTNVFSTTGTTSTATRTNLTVSIGGVQASAIKVSPNDPATVYVGTTSGNLYRVTNANTATPTTTQIASSLPGIAAYLNSIDVWKKVAGTADDSIVVAYSNYGINSVFLTANGSSATPTWTNIDDNSTLPDIPVRWAIFSPVNNRIVMLATEVGVFGSVALTGATTQWSQTNNGVLPMVRTDMIKPNSANQLAAATHGRGLWTSSTLAPLALRILAFSAAPKGEDVALQWTVSDDHEAACYTVERMYANEADFTAIGQVTAHNSMLYDATDTHPDWTRGAIVYRLKCTDISGKAFYSATRSVSKTEEFVFINAMYPTATDDEVYIQTGNTGATGMQVVIRNAGGQLILTQSFPYRDQTIHIGHLPAGLYFITATDVTGRYRQTTPVLKK